LLQPCTPYTPYTGALSYTPTLHEPTNTQPYKRITQPLHAYPTYIPYPYKPTKPYIPALPLHTYTTPTTPTTQHTLCYTLRIGPTPAHMLNEHMVG